MKKLSVIFTLLLLACVSGGCAVIPAIVTTGASFAVPQTASLAISAVGTVHKTALIAADERQLDEMVSDKMTTIQAEAVLLSLQGVDLEATCLNGDLYVVGEYTTPEARDEALTELEDLNGVRSVKGVLKPMPTSLVALIKPAISDKHAETVIETGLIKELNIKSANVDVEVVQGEAVIVGVVKDEAEAQSVVQLVEGLRPKTRTPIKVTSLLVLQDMFEADQPQQNELFALSGQVQVLADVAPVLAPIAENPVPQAEATSVAVTEKVSVASLLSRFPSEPSPWQKARLKMKRRLLSLAHAESDPKAKRELITLSSKVRKDTLFSIEDRLVKALHSTTNLSVRNHVNSILAEIAPQKTLHIQNVALN